MAGLDNPAVIDAITQTPEGEVVLIISHDRPWTDGDDELTRLVEKINNYAFSVLDEGIASAYPDAVEQYWSLRSRTASVGFPHVHGSEPRRFPTLARDIETVRATATPTGPEPT